MANFPSDPFLASTSLARPANVGHIRFIQSSPSPQVTTPVPVDIQSSHAAPLSGPPGSGLDHGCEDDPRYAAFRSRAQQSEARLLAVLRGDPIPSRKRSADQMLDIDTSAPDADEPPQPSKKISRQIDEDDYGDDDDDEDDDEGAGTSATAEPTTLNHAPTTGQIPPYPVVIPPPPDTQASAYSRSNTTHSGYAVPPFSHTVLAAAHEQDRTPSSIELAKSPDAIRLQLEKDKRTIEDEARRSCYTFYYTLETDRDALLEQQKLDELDRQIEKEMSAQAAAAATTGATVKQKVQSGSLSQSNLGASNLTLKHLIARIDSSRHLVHANDAQLRSLISEVRKNRSKWASEDKIGQEELYESAERVLIELKAQTEYASPFLQRVSKRDAPDYFSVIKTPMDIGTMLKRLKSLYYKSKKDFVDDLYLIWDNCMRYNRDPNHILRKKAIHMKKQTDKLVRLIPDIVIRDRAEVEAEERRLHNGLADGGDESDDEPIMASRGRKAPGKGRKNATTSRRGSEMTTETTPERKPFSTPLSSRPDIGRIDSEALDDFHTSQTPLHLGDALDLGSQSDPSDPDPTNGLQDLHTGNIDDADVDDAEYNAWKQVTKQYRAAMAAERNKLFRGSKLNPEQPALLRTQAAMRRWLRGRKLAAQSSPDDGSPATDGAHGLQNSVTTGATLAQDIEEDDSVVPDYYDVTAGIPDLHDRLRWEVDSSGQVIDSSEECLRVVPKGHFTAPPSLLTEKMAFNMRRMQQTRKICAKIAIVKQIQVQSQTYQNQFQKYDPEEFLEQDIKPHVVSDDGPIMCPVPCRAALQRSVAKIFYHSGFEEFQPSALDAVTDIAGQYFQNLAKTLKGYLEVPKVKTDVADSNITSKGKWQPRFSKEESILQTLSDNGTDLGQLESYTNDEMDRLRQKLDVMHDRMKSYYAELLRPALDPGPGADGVGAFADGSDQFIGGDFAEDIDEDFFGFRELGLDKEFGISFLSVPLHLLQNRLYNGFRSLNATSGTGTGVIMEQPLPYEPLTKENIPQQIGLVREFFTSRLSANKDQPLVEDDDLPVKQRFPKPRLPPNGKITCPRKRPIREQLQMARKKKQMEIKEAAAQANAKAAAEAGTDNSASRIRFNLPTSTDPPLSGLTTSGDPPPDNLSKPDDSPMVGMMSPESI